MSLLCNLACGAATAPVSYIVDSCDLTRRRSGQSYIAFVKCSYQFTDIQDAAEWTTAIGAGDVIVIGQNGSKWSLPAPEVTLFTDGLGNEIEIERDYSVPFETVNTALDGTDDLFFKRLADSYYEYRVILFTADGKMYTSDSYFDDIVASGAPTGTVLGESPGLEFSFSTVPHQVYGDTTNTLVMWAFTMSIKKSGQLSGMFIPGIYTAISA